MNIWPTQKKVRTAMAEPTSLSTSVGGFETLVRQRSPIESRPSAHHDSLLRAFQTIPTGTGSPMAYLSLTSKPEQAVRDHIAWTLANGAINSIIAREWSPGIKLPHFDSCRVDLCALEHPNKTDRLRAMFAAEFKVFGLLEQVHDIPPHHREAMAHDLLKLSELAREEHAKGNTDFVGYFVLIHQTHQDKAPPHLESIVKYAPLINRNLDHYVDDLEGARHQANENILEWLKELDMPPTNSGWLEIDLGSYWGINVKFDVLITQVL